MVVYRMVPGRYHIIIGIVRRKDIYHDDDYIAQDCALALRTSDLLDLLAFIRLFGFIGFY